MRAFPRHLWSSAAVVAALAVVRSASATSTLTINTTGVTRSNSSHPNNLNPTAISRADCLNDDVITVPLSVANYFGLTLQAWATRATDCTQLAARTSGTTATCGLVYSDGMINTATPTPQLRVRDIIHGIANPGSTSAQNAGTADDCSTALQDNTVPQELDIYFMFISNGTNVDSFQILKSQVALLGPAAPTGLGVGPGNTFLKLSWTTASAGTVAGYYFYCDPAPGTTPPPGGWTVLDAAPGTGGSGGSGGSGGTTTVCDASTDDSGDASDEASCVSSSGGGGSGGTGGTGGSGGSKGSTLTTCGSGALVSGTIPDPSLDPYRCGEANGQTANSGLVTGLTNDASYAVAVAAFDGLGNTGALAIVPECGTPGKTDDFVTVYRNLGGTAGSSTFCSLSGIGNRGRTPGFACIVTGLAWASLRSRRGRAKSGRAGAKQTNSK